MFAYFLEAVKRITIFLIISQAFLHLGIGVKYEKYMKLVISVMVVAQLIFSFIAYAHKDGIFTPVLEEKYYEQWDLYMEEMEKIYEIKEKELEQNITVDDNADKKETENKTTKQNLQKIIIPKIVVSDGK